MPGGPQHIALGSCLAGRGRWAAMGLLGSEGPAGRWPAPCLPLPPLQLPGAAGSGTGANRSSASSKGFLGAANRLPSAAGEGPGGLRGQPLPDAGSSLSSGAGRVSPPAPRPPADLPPGAWGDDRAAPGCWEQGGMGFGTGQLGTHLGREAGANTWMLPGRLGLGLLGPQWLGHS